MGGVQERWPIAVHIDGFKKGLQVVFQLFSSLKLLVSLTVCRAQVIDRTVSINVFKGEVLEDSLEEVVQYRQFTVQVGGWLSVCGRVAREGMEVARDRAQRLQMRCHISKQIPKRADVLHQWT